MGGRGYVVAPVRIKVRGEVTSSTEPTKKNQSQTPKEPGPPAEPRDPKTETHPQTPGLNPVEMPSTCKTPTSSGPMMMMMMVMMVVASVTDAAAVGKSGSHSKHRKLADGGAVAEMVPLQIDPDALVPPRNLRPLQNASISPWTYNVSHDDSLLPPMLSEARCLLRGCLDSDGKEDLSLESRPIMHQVLLLRRVRAVPGVGSGSVEVGHNFHFRLESRLIAVGCTCVRPTVQQQD